MYRVSTLRLNVLRVMYLIIAVGLGVFVWPAYLRAPAGVEHMHGVVLSVLVAVSLLALLGIRYPLQMIPLLMFELLWKSMWMLAIGLPLWMAGTLGGPEAGTMLDTLVGIVLVPLALPWGYVFDTFFRRRSEPWRGASVAPPAEAS
jgi:hypothetical protein